MARINASNSLRTVYREISELNGPGKKLMPSNVTDNQTSIVVSPQPIMGPTVDQSCSNLSADTNGVTSMRNDSVKSLLIWAGVAVVFPLLAFGLSPFVQIPPQAGVLAAVACVVGLIGLMVTVVRFAIHVR